MHHPLELRLADRSKGWEQSWPLAFLRPIHASVAQLTTPSLVTLLQILYLQPGHAEPLRRGWLHFALNSVQSILGRPTPRGAIIDPGNFNLLNRFCLAYNPGL